MHFTRALPNFTRVQAQVCPGADTPLVGEVFRIAGQKIGKKKKHI